jgi:hypothetical protein
MYGDELLEFMLTEVFKAVAGEFKGAVVVGDNGELKHIKSAPDFGKWIIKHTKVDLQKGKVK